MVVHAYNPSTQVAEAGGSLRFGGQPELQSEFKANPNCIVKMSQKVKKKGGGVDLAGHGSVCL